MDLFFSVIIPLYNKELSVSKSLSSVLNQTYGKFEIIIINDGSTDRSLKVAEQITDSRCKIFTTKNQGVSAARNFGVSLANHNLIAFIDADDVWKPHHLHSLTELIKEFPACHLYAKGYERIFNERIINNRYNNPLIDTNFKGVIDNFFKANLKSSLVMVPSIVIKKDIYETLGGFNTEYNSGEDIDFWIRFGLQYKLVFSGNISVEVNLNSENKLTQIPVKRKSAPMLLEYKEIEAGNPNLKKYLNLNRFVWALEYGLQGDIKRYLSYLSEIDKNYLSFYNKLVIKIPLRLLSKLIAGRNWMLKRGFYLRLVR